MNSQQWASHLITVLEEKKAEEVVSLFVREHTTLTDYMLIATGHSGPHLSALANYLREESKKRYPIVGMEGEKNREWILIDFGVVIVHLMLPEIRSFYNLEVLWALDKKD